MTEIDFKNIRCKYIDPIGKGAYGTVFTGEWNNKTVAVKRVLVTHENQNKIQREIDNLSRAKHDNIIAFYGWATKDLNYYLVTEYMVGGSLSNFLHNSTDKYPGDDPFNWLRQIAKGLKYLHTLSPPLIHRDVKPSNMLLDASRQGLKLCDFGTVKNVVTKMTSKIGTYTYMAPEIFEGNLYDESCDSFSFAIAMWEILTRRKPYETQECNIPDFMTSVSNGLRPDGFNFIFNCDEEIKKLIADCWDKNSQRRRTMHDILIVLDNLWPES